MNKISLIKRNQWRKNWRFLCQSCATGIQNQG